MKLLDLELETEHILASSPAISFLPMPRTPILLSGLTALVLSPIGVLWFVHKALVTQSPPIGKPLPPLSLSTVNGAPFSLDGYRGQKYALVFFTVECSHCRKEIANLSTLHTALRDAFHVFAVSLSTPEATEEFLANNGPSFPVFLTNPGTSEFKVTAVPSLFLVNEAGLLCRQLNGDRPLAEEGKIIDSFFGGHIAE